MSHHKRSKQAIIVSEPRLRLITLTKWLFRCVE
ncbi:hypothetical protein MED222_04860 [Vibrio sp. MED222]|nr:hypothetical protein MED222_04860 [Vibrio sp. MED222]